jgi:plastocyanin
MPTLLTKPANMRTSMNLKSRIDRRLGRRATTVGAIFGLMVFAAMGLAAAQAADATTVRIDNFSFVPDNVTVSVGTTVTWENDDDIPHSVVMSDKSFRSKPLDTHDKTTFTFTKPGAVEYFCGLHPHMKGKITVVP